MSCVDFGRFQFMATSESESSESAEAQMGPWEVGQIKAHMEHDLGATAISRHVLKPDGESTWTRGANHCEDCSETQRKKENGSETD